MTTLWKTALSAAAPLATIRFTDAADKVETIAFANGDARFIPAGTIDTEVATSGTPKAVTIEVK